MRNTDIVKNVYQLFTRGDVTNLLAVFDEGIEFRLAEGHPYQPSGQAWIGKEAVTRNFFMKAGPEWERWSIALDELLDMGDAVVAECRYAGIYKPTGHNLDVQVCHVWKLRNGKVTSFHQYLDTARLQHVMGVSA